MVKLITARRFAAELEDAANNAATSIRFAVFSATAPTPRTHVAAARAYNALAAAAERGCACHALLGVNPTGSLTQQGTEQAAAWLADNGWGVRHYNGLGVMHAKAYLFDEKLAIIGSYNLTPAAMYSNNEAAIMTDDPEVIADLQRWWP